MVQLISDPFTSYGPSYPVDLNTGNYTQPGWATNPVEVSSSGVATASAGSLANCAALWSGTIVQTGDSWPADQYAEIVLGTVTVGCYFDAEVRCGAGATKTRVALEVNTNTTTQYLYVQNNGTLVATYTFTATPATGDTWRLSVTGTTYTVTQNGTTRLTQVDSTLSSGIPGFGLAEQVIITSGTITKFNAGANQAATPTFSPNGGSFGPAQTVTITSSTSGGTIYYTTDGSTPTHSSSSISNGGTISVSSTATVKAFVSVSNFADSTIGNATFTINGAVTTSTFSPAAGTYATAQSVTVSNADSALAGFAQYYTTDGSTPTTGSTPVSGPITVSNSLTLKVLAVATNYSNSAIASAAYVIGGGGAIGWSPVDSRQAVPGFGPSANTGIVDEQGNVIYSAQKPPFTGNSQVSDNSAIPPVDSRAVGAPIDSRASIPENSRVAPPFGGVGEP